MRQHIRLQVQGSHKTVCCAKGVQAFGYWTLSGGGLISKSREDGWQVPPQILDCHLLRQPSCVLDFLNIHRNTDKNKIITLNVQLYCENC